MPPQGAITKKALESITPERRDLWDELNLPPEIASFIRKNARLLQIGLATLVALLIVWQSFSHYLDVREKKSAALLAQAMEEKDEPRRRDLLNRIMTEYSRSEASVWSRVELAHEAAKAGNYEESVKMYTEALDRTSGKSPILPLLELGIASSLESKNELDQAAEHYTRLTQLSGFAPEGYLGLGRVYERKNDPAKAKEAYEKYLAAVKDQPGEMKAWVEERLARLGK